MRAQIREQMIELTHTDLPDPVAPAISRCGVCARSTIWHSPEIPCPRPIGSLVDAARKSLCSRRVRKPTMARERLGTSMPTACLPGIGATMRTREAASCSAMLSARLTIEESFTPAAGRISYIVIAGPRLMPVTSALMRNSCSVSLSTTAFCSASACSSASGRL